MEPDVLVIVGDFCTIGNRDGGGVSISVRNWEFLKSLGDIFGCQNVAFGLSHYFLWFLNDFLQFLLEVWQQKFTNILVQGVFLGWILVVPSDRVDEAIEQGFVFFECRHLIFN